jgi:hypothetical protein
MVRLSAAKQLLNVPLSNNTISRQIDDMCEEKNYQLIEKIKDKYFSIQLDEATYNNTNARSMCYMVFEDLEDNSIDLLFFKSYSRF